MSIIDRIDGLNQGVAYKAPVRVATTANITLSGTQTVDGIALLADDRIIVKDQTDATENGIYIVSSSDWQRSKDFDGARDVTEGTVVLTLYGSANSGNFYRLTTTDDPVDFGSSNITFSLHSTLGTAAVKDNVSATAAPAVTDDSSQGYSISSLWIDTTNDVGYICYDVTVGAAVWVRFINLGANNTFTGNNTFSGITTLSGSSVISGLTTVSAIMTHTADLRMLGKQFSQAIGADVASASALPISKDGNYYSVTGLADIDSIITTGRVGTIITLEFTTTLNLNHHATDLILIGGATIVTAAGDTAEFIEYASGDFKMLRYSSSSNSPGCSLYQTNGTSVPTGAWTPLAFDTEEYDDVDWHDNVTNNSRITFDFTGRVNIIGGYDSGSATGNAVYGLAIYKNGSLAAYVRYDLAAGLAKILAIADIFNVVPTDYFELYAYQSSGAAAISGASIANTRFKAQRMM